VARKPVLSGRGLRVVPLLLALLALLGAGWYLHNQGGRQPGRSPDAAAGQPAASKDAAQLAFESRSRGSMITIHGTVERILADDRDGSPHQRFILRSTSGVSVLIAHNLDLAPRLEGLAPGDALTVLGEYEWNEMGGLMHWTHKDPDGKHVNGYIEWRGRRYQ
jgi:Protein of unknown function (DUF3465)